MRKGSTKSKLAESLSMNGKSSKEETIRVKSLLIGMILGASLGVPISISLGSFSSPGMPMPAPSDIVGNLKMILVWFDFSILLGCIIAFVSSGFLWRRMGEAIFRTCVLSSLTVLALWIYISFIMTFIFVPFNAFLLQYLTPVSVFWYAALVFFPFMIIIAYILFPSLRPRIKHTSHSLITRQFWSEIRRNPERHRKMLFLTTALMIIIVVDILRALYA
jgi:hypothetical protein